MLIIGNGRLITRDNKQPYFENGAVVVEDNVIVEAGQFNAIKAKYPEAEFVDAKGKLIMPGMINTHHHIYSAFARGMALKNAKPMTNFDEILEGLWWRVDKVLNLEDVMYSAYTTYIDSIKNGVTTVFDHHASQNDIATSLFTIGDVAKKLGIRTSLCYEVTDRDGEERTNNAIKENVDFIKYANNDSSDMLKGMLGLHASFTVSDKTLEKCVTEMGSLDAGYHVHTAEGIGDVHACLKEHGKRVVNRFLDAGILGKKTICVHGIHINKQEMEIIRDTNTMMVHNPESNMGNAVGCAPILKVLENGILLGLGTDGYTSDMFESYKVGNILHKHSLCDPTVAWGEIPQMLFENNRNIAGRFFKKPVGILEKGAYADIILVDYDPLTPMDENNVNGHLLFGVMGRNVVSTMINGKFVMKDRELVNIDEKAIFNKSREVAQKFWNRINA